MALENVRIVLIRDAGVRGPEARDYVQRHRDRLIVDRRVGNVVCSAGLAQWSGALGYSGIVDQNAALAVPESTAFGWPVYGAFGSGAAAVTSGDVALAVECTDANYRRSPIQNAVLTTTTVEWDFFWGGAYAATIRELGVFLAAAPVSGGAGQLLSHAGLVTISKTAGDAVFVTWTYTWS